VVKAQARADAVAARMRANGDERTLEQLRADAVGDFLTGRGTKDEVKARVTVTVPLTAFRACQVVCVSGVVLGGQR
jgi:hypothetical protein